MEPLNPGNRSLYRSKTPKGYSLAGGGGGDKISTIVLNCSFRRLLAAPCGLVLSAAAWTLSENAREASCGPDLIPAEHRVPDQSVSLFSSSFPSSHPSNPLSLARSRSPSPLVHSSLVLFSSPFSTHYSVTHRPCCTIEKNALFCARTHTHSHTRGPTRHADSQQAHRSRTEISQRLYGRRDESGTVCSGRFKRLE